MLETGVPVTLDIDDDLIFDDIRKVIKMTNLTKDQLQQLNRNAQETRFGNRKPISVNITPSL